jgi:NAD(P)H dehydrogenase (quinone)
MQDTYQTEDIGKVAAELLQQNWTARRVVELEGPRRITPLYLAATCFNHWGVLCRPSLLPFDSTGKISSAFGVGSNPIPRMRTGSQIQAPMFYIP